MFAPKVNHPWRIRLRIWLSIKMPTFFGWLYPWSKVEFKSLMLPMVRQVYPKIVAEDLVSVQPMKDTISQKYYDKGSNVPKPE